MEEVAVTIIGAGVIGLAIAAEIAGDYESIVLLERHETFGQETSSRNSEVIHAGIYYPKDSLKALTCVEGAELLYRYCNEHSVPHVHVGKLIVASEQSELARLDSLFHNGMENGVEELSIIDQNDISRIEPSVTALAAIHSPRTGIFDSHSFMKNLYNKALSSGVIFSFNSRVDVISPEKKGYVMGIGNEDYRFFSRIVINAAGLSSDRIAALAGIDLDRAGYRLEYIKGSYFAYSKKSPVSRLVYPLPGKDRGGLGIHATIDTGGRLRFGPDAERIASINYTVESGKRELFFENASRYLKGLDREAFIPDMAGIRPAMRGEGFHDFIIRHETEKGLSNFINLIGIESPGLTASLSIARRVKTLLQEN